MEITLVTLLDYYVGPLQVKDCSRATVDGARTKLGKFIRFLAKTGHSLKLADLTVQDAPLRQEDNSCASSLCAVSKGRWFSESAPEAFYDRGQEPQPFRSIETVTDHGSASPVRRFGFYRDNRSAFRHINSVQGPA